MILAPLPGIDDNPRLQKPITIVAGTISTRQILERVSKATGVKLAWSCPFEDPLMSLSIKGETAGDVLGMVSDCLNLGWRTSGNRYELFMPASTAKKEQEYRIFNRRAVAALLAKYAIEWRDPRKQLKYPEAEVGYTNQVLSYDKMSQILSVLTKRNQARLLDGETLVFSTNAAPGTELMKPVFPQTPKPDAEFLAIRLDLINGKLRTSQWAVLRGKLTALAPAIFPLFRDPDKSHPGRELIRRSGYADPWNTKAEDDSIDLYIDRLTQKDDQAISRVPPGFGDIDAWFEMFAKYHFGPVVIVRPPLIQYNYRLSEGKHVLGAPYDQYWRPGLGYFREYNNASYWRPVNYWYRNELARTQRVGNLQAYKDPSFLKLMDNMATIGLGSILWNIECFGLDSTVRGTPPSRLPSFCRLWKSMSVAQKKASIESVEANASIPRKRSDVAQGSLALSQMGTQQRLLAQMAIKEMLSGPWYWDNQKGTDMAKLLDPKNESKLYLKIRASRMVKMFFIGDESYYEPGGGLLTPSKWKTSYNSPKGKSLFGTGNWIVWLTFGVKDGPKLTSLFMPSSPFVRIPANVVNNAPHKAYQQFMKAMNRPVY